MECSTTWKRVHINNGQENRKKWRRDSGNSQSSTSSLFIAPEFMSNLTDTYCRHHLRDAVDDYVLVVQVWWVGTRTQVHSKCKEDVAPPRHSWVYVVTAPFLPLKLLFDKFLTTDIYLRLLPVWCCSKCSSLSK